MNAKKTAAAVLAAAALACGLAVPAGALGQPNITAGTTMGEIRANESLQASGFDTYDRNVLIPEQPWMYDDWTLEEYLGGTAPDAAQGLNLVIDNYNRGVQVTYQIYTPEEIAADPSKAEVQLYYFPAETENARYALVVPGNMYEKSAKMREGCSVSYHMHQMGYASFVLRYSVGRDNGDNAAYNDLVRAVRFITENAEMFGVQPEDYALVGFSAGGQMCGVFGTSRMGYKTYRLPKPGALLLGYPVINYMYAKPLYFYLYDGAEPGDSLAPGDYYYNIEVAAEVDGDFPPVYHWFGLNDATLMLMDIFCQGPALDKALEESGVPHQMVIFRNARHRTSVGTGTDAAGWLYDAVSFWEAVTAEEEKGE